MFNQQQHQHASTANPPPAALHFASDPRADKSPSPDPAAAMSGIGGSAMLSMLLAAQSQSSQPLLAAQDRPFSCPVPHCGGRFHRKFTLHEHMKTHTGEKPHVCPIASCGKRFSTSGNLARHKRLHTLSKLKCPVTECTRIFTKKEKLIRHLKVHMGTTPHTCQVADCSKTFSTAGNLTRHMKSQHPTHSIVKPAKESTKASSSGAATKALSSRFIRKATDASGHHDHRHQAPVTTDGLSLDSSNFVVASASAAENISDYEIMELLDSLFVEPVLTADDCGHQSQAYFLQQQQQQQQQHAHVVFL